MPASKLQRWTDLLAALLRRRYPAALEELVLDVPAYGSAPSTPALRRMFERDKEELRAFGVPIETVRNEAGEATGYRLRPQDFYLPYLAVAGSRARPRRLDREGYRALKELAFEPDELRAVAAAAKRIEALGNPTLAEHARAARRKLAADLPLDAAAEEDPDTLLPARARVDPAVFEALDSALARRKQVAFDYYSMSSDLTTRRTVEPYGLFFLGQHWYLVGRESWSSELQLTTCDPRPIKNFRLSRITNPSVNTTRPGTPDYKIPADFRLREHARSRRAWELGEGDAIDVTVEFASPDGAAVAAARLGEAVQGAPNRRRFRVRRADTFVRWLLSLAGSARPVAPRALCDEYRRQLEATLALYRESDRQ